MTLSFEMPDISSLSAGDRDFLDSISTARLMPDRATEQLNARITQTLKNSYTEKELTELRTTAKALQALIDTIWIVEQPFHARRKTAVLNALSDSIQKIEQAVPLKTTTQVAQKPVTPIPTKQAALRVNRDIFQSQNTFLTIPTEPPPSNPSLQELLTLFKRLNIQDPRSIVNNEITPNIPVSTQDEARNRMKRYLNRLVQNISKQEYLSGGPQKTSPHFPMFHNQLKISAQHIIASLQARNDPDLTQKTLVRLMKAAFGCAGEYETVTTELYQQVCTQVSVTTPKNTFIRELGKFKDLAPEAFVDALIREIPKNGGLKNAYIDLHTSYAREWKSDYYNGLIKDLSAARDKEAFLRQHGMLKNSTQTYEEAILDDQRGTCLSEFAYDEEYHLRKEAAIFILKKTGIFF